MASATLGAAVEIHMLPNYMGSLCMVSFFSIDHMTHDGSMHKTQVTQPLNIGILHGPQGHSGSQILDPRAAH